MRNGFGVIESMSFQSELKLRNKQESGATKSGDSGVIDYRR